MSVEIGTEAKQFLFWEYINGIFVAVRAGVKLLSPLRPTSFFVTITINKGKMFVFFTTNALCRGSEEWRGQRSPRSG
jgi:hypothetical protein